MAVYQISRLLNSVRTVADIHGWSNATCSLKGPILSLSELLAAKDTDGENLLLLVKECEDVCE